MIRDMDGQSCLIPLIISKKILVLSIVYFGTSHLSACLLFISLYIVLKVDSSLSYIVVLFKNFEND